MGPQQRKPPHSRRLLAAQSRCERIRTSDLLTPSQTPELQKELETQDLRDSAQTRAAPISGSRDQNPFDDPSLAAIVSCWPRLTPEVRKGTDALARAVVAGAADGSR